MTDVNDIKAGTYLLVAEFWDEHLSKPGQPFDFKRHRRGEVLDLNVDDARRLVLAGAVLPYDPENPTHAVQADGSVVELTPSDPTSLVIAEAELQALVTQGVVAEGATSEDLVAAVRDLQQQAAAAADAEAKVKAAEEAQAKAEAAVKAARDAQAKAEADAKAAASGPSTGGGSGRRGGGSS